jgi:uncharacterized protein (DUF927 family)
MTDKPSRKRGGNVVPIIAAVRGAAPFTGGPGGADPEVQWPPGFEMRADGLYRLPTKDDQKAQRLCGPFEVLAETRPDGNDAWGLLLRWKDRDGFAHQWIMPRALLAGEAADLRARLAACGLDVSQSQGARAALVQCLAAIRCDRRARTVPRIGWHITETSAAYVLPGAVLGVPPAKESLQLDIDPAPIQFRQRGTLTEWRAGVAGRCVGNARLVFAVSAAFAGALVTPLGEEGGGFHFRGRSTQGKTTALRIGASVWGNPAPPSDKTAFARQWRATANALEVTAQSHNDCLLVLDEINQADPREIGETSYMLASGQGKDRMRDRGGLRRTATWNMIFLSSGEESMGDFMAKAGRIVKAGMEVRLIDIPADAGAGFGLFEDLHGEADANAFSRAIYSAALEHYGTAGPAFVEWFATKLAGDRFWPSEELLPRVRAFVARVVPPGADGQVQRVAWRFALVALAGELATLADVTGWEPGTAETAAETCFRAWLDARGGAGAREAQQIIAAVRRFIGLHGAARFETIKDGAEAGDMGGEQPADPRTINRAGWKWIEHGEDGHPVWRYGIIPEVFATEICQPLGADPREARRMLHAAGMLETRTRDGKVRLLIRKRIAGHGRLELVGIRIDGPDGDDEAERGA